MMGQVLKLVMVSLVAGGVAVAGQTATPAQGVVATYLEIQAALANDSFEGVPAAAKSLAAQAAKLGVEGEPVAKAAKAVAAATDIKAARDAFAPLSDAVIAVVKANPAVHDVKMAYCPMAKASWLQTEEKIRNPYYGSSMLSCGEFRPLDRQ
jgi:hypothetical protein